MSIAPGEVLDVLEDLARAARRFGQIVQTPSGLTVGVPQIGHSFGGFGLAQPLALAPLDQRRDDLRDHVAGAGDDHLVALADVLAGQVLLVVEGRRSRR